MASSYCVIGCVVEEVALVAPPNNEMHLTRSAMAEKARLSQVISVLGDPHKHPVCLACGSASRSRRKQWSFALNAAFCVP
jgi:hypothetical protein